MNSFDLVGDLWHTILPWLWVTAWLVPTWFMAYVLRATAPQGCPEGDDYHECETKHPFHVLRNNSAWCLLYGLGWPIWLGLGGFWLARRSVDGAVAITPMPKPKKTLDPSITSGGMTTEELLARIEAHNEALEALESEPVIHHADAVWDPPTRRRVEDMRDTEPL